MSSFSKDSRSMTWHQWQVGEPMERKMGLSPSRAFWKASSPQARQSTGLWACWSRYGLFSWMREFDGIAGPLLSLWTTTSGLAQIHVELALDVQTQSGRQRRTDQDLRQVGASVRRLPDPG